MLDGGYIKLHRKLTKWEWYHNANTFRVFIHLLLTANYEPRRFEGRTIERGQRVASMSSLAKELKMSIKAVRVSIEHLKTTGEISVASSARFTIFTVNNYEEYQKVDFIQLSSNKLTTAQKTANQMANKTANSENPENRMNTEENQLYFFERANQTANKTANEGQTKGKLRANQGQQWKKDKESKRKIKKRERGALSPHGTFGNVFLSDSEVADLKSKYPHHYQSKIDRLSRVIESKGKDYSNHYATLLDWLMQDVGLPGKATQDDTTKTSSYDIDELEEINTLEDWA